MIRQGHWRATLGLVGGPNLYRQFLRHWLETRHALEVLWDVEGAWDCQGLAQPNYLVLVDQTPEDLRGLPTVRAMLSFGSLLCPQVNLFSIPEASSLSDVDASIERMLAAGPARSTALTRCEKRVLHLLSRGMSTNQTANELHISNNTLKTHLSNLYRKLGAKGRTQALIHGWRLGLIPLANRT